jgi:hypothetical protein
LETRHQEGCWVWINSVDSPIRCRFYCFPGGFSWKILDVSKSCV